jgi:hypothetical protein
MAKSLFPVDPVMTAIVIAYRNKRLIADEIFPYVPVGKSLFKYLVFDLEQGFTLPSTLVGRKSTPNKVEFGGSEVEAACADYFLDDVIPQSDIDDAPEGVNLINNASEGIIDLILLDREVRAAGLTFDADQYATGCKASLSGSDRFDDYVASDPVNTIKDALSSMLMRGNVMVIGRKAFDKLSSHPKIVKAVNANSGDSGIVTRAQLANLFELDDVVVGEAFLNTNKKGEAMSLSRVWGNHMALIYRDKLANNANNRMTFGFTARQGTRMAGVIADQMIGARGSHIVRAGETVKEVITSNRLGYLLQNIVG